LLGHEGGFEFSFMQVSFTLFWGILPKILAEFGNHFLSSSISFSFSSSFLFIFFHFFQKSQLQNIDTFCHFLCHINNFFIIIQINIKKKLATKQNFFYKTISNFFILYITLITSYYYLNKNFTKQSFTKQCH
jgi:hypothetical protein